MSIKTTSSSRVTHPTLKSALFISLAALVLRLAFVILGGQYHFAVDNDHFQFGWEMGRLGRSIATGAGFSSPFAIEPTGPTAFAAPLYPYLVAGVFKLFGVYSVKSALALLITNCLLGALTCWVVFQIAKLCFDERAAVFSAWGWAIFPPVVWPVRWVWETSFTAWLFSLILLLILRAEGRPSQRAWCLLGFLWGVMALTSPAPLAVLPLLMVWLLLRVPGSWFARLQLALLSAIVFFLTITPWLVRDYLTFGQFVFIRDNFGVALHLGNTPESRGQWVIKDDPSFNRTETEKIRRMGEVVYAKERGREAFAFIRQQAQRFIQYALRRIAYFWGNLPNSTGGASYWIQTSLSLLFSILSLCGLVATIGAKHRGTFLFACVMLVFPLAYYLTIVLLRYRHPIEPEMMILCGFLLTRFRIPRGSTEPGILKFLP